MADFKEVMREHHRMCDYHHHCIGCPLEDEKYSCDPAGCNGDILKLGDWETKVMSWSKAHPPKIFPTYREVINYLTANTNNLDKPIPEELANELNIMPINEGGLKKYAN